MEAREIIPVIREAVHAIDPNILVGGSTAVAFDTDVSANRDNRTIIPIVLVLITLILGFFFAVFCQRHFSWELLSCHFLQR